MGHAVEFMDHIVPLMGYVDFIGQGVLFICHSVSFMGYVVAFMCHGVSIMMDFTESLISH